MNYEAERAQAVALGGQHMPMRVPLRQRLHEQRERLMAQVDDIDATLRLLEANSAVEEIIDRLERIGFR